MTPQESSLSSREKNTIASDSGISEFGRNSASSNSSSSSSLYAPCISTEIVNEKTPLLSGTGSEAGDDVMTDSAIMRQSMMSAIMVPVPTTQGQQNSTLEYSFSFPKLLKNISLTEFGACEI